MKLSLIIVLAGIAVATVNGRSPYTIRASRQRGCGRARLTNCPGICITMSGKETQHFLSKRGIDATNILEVIVFVDQNMVDYAANKLPNRRSGDNRELMRTMVKGMFNNVQALFRNPTLQYKFDVQVLQIVFLDKNAVGDGGGINAKLHKNFCTYTKNLPRDGWTYPKDWDVAVLVTGTDIYNPVNNDYSISGYAIVSGACDYEEGCAIVEARNKLKGDSFVLAHELGHSLGINHDGEDDNTDCRENSYIMSGSPDYNRNGDWSKCSYRNLKKYMNSDWAKCFGNNPLTSSWANKVVAVDTLPGLLFSAEEQCIYQKGAMYKVFSGIVNRNGQSFQADLCSELFCQKPGSTLQEPIGSALDGTPCGNNKYQGCFNNKCVPLHTIPANRFIGSQNS